LAAIVVVGLLGASAGRATDGFVATSTSAVAVAAGGTATAAETVHLDPLPAKADIVLAFDTTGSMGGAIALAQSDATAIVNSVQTAIPGARFAVADFRDYPIAAYVDASSTSDYPFQLDSGLTADASTIQAKVNALTIGNGGDAQEAYNRVFYEAFADSNLDGTNTSPSGGTPDLQYAPGAERFLIVLGDQVGHDPSPGIDPTDCPATQYADAGRDGQVGTADDLTTQPGLDGLKAHGISLSFVSYAASGSAIQNCQKALATYTGGSVVQGSTSDTSGAAGTLAGQIVTLVQNASAHIGALSATATSSDAANPATWVTFTGLPSTFDVNQSTGSDVPFNAVVSPPPGTAPGTYNVTVNVVADGVTRATQQLAITVRTPLSNVTISASPATAGAGIDSVPIASVPGNWLAYYAGSTSSAPIGSSPIGSSPIGSSPIGSSPIGSSPIGSSPIGSSPIGSSPIGSSGLFDMPIGSSPIGSSALADVLLSQITLTGGASWSQILCGTLVGAPLDTLTLADLANGNCADGTTSQSRFKALPYNEVDLSTTLLKSLHWASLVLGNTLLSALPGGRDAWCNSSDPTQGLVPQNGGSCAGVTSSTTVLGLDVAGQLGSAPIGSSPIGSSPIGSSGLASVKVASLAINASRLALIPVAGTSGLVSCTDCATLGAAATENAINPTLTFSDPAFLAALNTVSPQITVNDVIVALLGATGFPWEQLPVQGLQPYSTTQSHVTYTVGVTVDCSVVTGFSLSAHLPAGFFPVPGTAKYSLGSGASQDAGTPQVVGRDEASAAKLNTYRWPLSCGSATSPSTVATLTFDAYAGLTLGAFSAQADATAGTFSISTSGAAVNVVQNLEPNDDPSAALPISPDTLVVGHIAASGDQDYYSLNLTGLPLGTKITAFLKVPSGTDFDLTITKPAAQSFFSTPIGSSPIGSSPITDSGVGFDSSGLALPSETLQDIPIGSSPIGSSPIGSSSTNRGDANEAATIITAGETGVATIGITGYNGASSASPYVLRVHETPPPALPPSCPARVFPNGQPSGFPAGTLPASLPSATKSVFVVDTQQLDGLYGTAATSSLLSAIGSQSTSGSFAARPEVTGSVLDVSGSAAVRNAYAAWNQTPCDVTLRNNVVRAINDVVASYRNSATGLPSLHYEVLLGTDDAVPMAATPDPVTLSPEENEASDLAFMTNGLTTDNALYATSAQNYLLTDGAYGAFTSIPWLGHDLLLPQISVSRLVESPGDMVNEIKQYLLQSGSTATPVEPSAGTLNPTSAAVTGYDFMADGAQAMRSNLRSNFTGLTTLDTLGADPSISVPGSGTTPWTATDLNSSIFTSTAAPGILGLNGHYNHFEIEAADGSLSDSGHVSATLPGRVVFTMGCHGGLSVADTLSGVSGAKALDWPQLYAQKGVAVYIGNTGFGYGDTASVALSERLYALFAKNLHSDGNSVGEEWDQALQQYFATAGAYTVYDEKVMEESTFYGLPFWHFSTAGSASSFTPLTTSADPVTGTQSATVVFPSGSTSTSTEFGLYRPELPLVSQEVTSTLPARGVWIKSLSSQDTSGVSATIGMPTVDLSGHEPAPNVQPIFFPASPFTLERSLALGKERDFLNVSDQYRPGSTAVQRHFTAGTFEIFYSQSPDSVPPLISQVNVSFAGGTATIQSRVSDSDSTATVDEVAALVNDGSWHYVQLTKSTADPTVWTGSIAVARDPEVFVEATDGSNVAYSANKGSNFTSANSSAPNGTQILLQAPTGPYTLNQSVNATYQCLVNGAALPAAQCKGTAPNGQPIDTTTFGIHTFVVTAYDTNGNVIGSLQREYVVQYSFKGFFSPVDNEPVFNVAKAGSAIPVKFSLTGNQGLNIFFDSTYPKSQMIACDASAPADGIESTVTAGSSSLTYDATSDQYSYVWKTDSGWAGTCRALILKMKDGTMHRADFKFTK
jgi:hypothetical protein